MAANISWLLSPRGRDSRPMICADRFGAAIMIFGNCSHLQVRFQAEQSRAELLHAVTR